MGWNATHSYEALEEPLHALFPPSVLGVTEQLVDLKQEVDAVVAASPPVWLRQCPAGDAHGRHARVVEYA